MTATDKPAVLNQISLPATDATLAALADNLGVHAASLHLTQDTGFSGILLAVGPNATTGIVFFDTASQATAKRATVNDWWKQELHTHADKVGAASVLPPPNASVDPNARMVWWQPAWGVGNPLQHAAGAPAAVGH